MVPNHHWRAFLRGTVALLCAACLSFSGPLQARHPDLDLDALSDDDFLAMLDDELDDDDLEACGFGDLNAAHSTQQAYNVVICALGDAGDTGDETALDYDDLQAEMREAGTSVEAVVRAAIDEADRRSTGPLTRELLVAALRREGGMPSTDSETSYPEWFAQILNRSINPPTDNIRGPVKTGINRARKAG